VLVGAGLGRLEHEAEELRSTARELLSRPPYREAADGPVTDLLRRAREAVARFVELVLGTVSGDTRVAWVIVAVGTALLALVVWRATRGWNADRTVAAVPEVEPARSAADWVADAGSHAAAGRWRDAVRCRYAALVTTLVEQGTVDDVAGRTVGELDREVELAAPTLAPAVRRAGDTFEEVWYGHAAAGPDEMRVIVDATDELFRRLGGRREVPV
jgi:hypothetical protein